jgi:TorA maturation chaperone TorD
MGFHTPNEEIVRSLSSAETMQALRGAALLLDRHGLAAEASRFGRERMPPLRDLKQDYNRLFGHTLRGKVCPYETEYGKAHSFQQAHILSDLAGFYLAFGLRPAISVNERVDHIAYQLEFLEFLSRKEAFALEQGDEEMLEIARHALKKFLREHLGRFGRAVGSRLRQEDQDGFYGKLGSLCSLFLRTECEGQGVLVASEVLELRSFEEEHVPMACGTGDERLETGATRFDV